MIAIICNLILILKMPSFLGIMRMFSPLLPSLSTTIQLAGTTMAIGIILLASNLVVSNAQQQEGELKRQPLGIENGTATRTALSTQDSFSVLIPLAG